MSALHTCCFRRQAASALAALVLSASSALAAEQPFAKWFKYRPDVEKAWDITGDANQPLQVTVRPKAGVGPQQRIMVIYPRPSSAYDTAMSTILRVFADKEINAEFNVVNFEVKDDKGIAAIKAAEQSSVDLIFAMGSESTAWLHQNYRGGRIPVVSVCAKDPVQLGQMKDYDNGSGNNFAFTSLNVPVDVQMAYVRELRPQLKTIAILVDSKNISAVQTQAEPIAAYGRQHGIKVIWTSVQNPADARAELATLVPAAVDAMRETDPGLNNSVFWITGSTSVFREIRTINQFSGKVPVISVVPEIVTSGPDTAALAIGISFESNATLAAIYGTQILNGRPPGAIKVGVVSPPDIAISFLKAREIGMRIPFNFFEIASFIYDHHGHPVRSVKNEIATN